MSSLKIRAFFGNLSCIMTATIASFFSSILSIWMQMSPRHFLRLRAMSTSSKGGGDGALKIFRIRFLGSLKIKKYRFVKKFSIFLTNSKGFGHGRQIHSFYSFLGGFLLLWEGTSSVLLCLRIIFRSLRELS